MTELQDMVKKAYDAQHAPRAAKEGALAAIEALRCEEESSRAHVVGTKRHTRTATKRVFMAVAACLVLCAVAFGGVRALATPAAYVDIDINPSLELGVNTFGTVVSAQAYNDDAQHVLDSCNVKGMSADDAISAVLAASDSYIDDTSYVGIAVSCDNASLRDSLVATAQDNTYSLPCQAHATAVDTQTLQQAKEQGMGMARYQAAVQLIQVDSSYTMDDCRNMTMRQLVDAAQASSHDDASVSHSIDDAAQKHGEGGKGAGLGNGSGASKGSGAGNGVHGGE